MENLPWRGRPPTCGRSGRRGGVPRGKRPCARLGRGRRSAGEAAEVIVERIRCFTRSLGGGFKCLKYFYPEILGKMIQFDTAGKLDHNARIQLFLGCRADDHSATSFLTDAEFP